MNFEYMKHQHGFVTLYNACKEAEEFALIRPSISAASARKAMEFVVKYLYAEVDPHPSYGLTVYDMIRDLILQDRFADSSMPARIEAIRKIGNIAVHQGNLTAEDSMLALEQLHNLVGEFAVGLGFIEEYPAFIKPLPNRIGRILRSIHPDNFNVNLLPYLRAEGHGDWATILTRSRKTHIAELLHLPPELNCDAFIEFLHSFERSIKEEKDVILDALPISAATESEWNARRERLPEDAVNRIELFVESWLYDHPKAGARKWTQYNQALGDRAAAFLQLVHPEYVPASMREAYVKPDMSDVSELDAYIPLEEALRQLLRHYVAENPRKRQLLTRSNWCREYFGLPVQAIRNSPPAGELRAQYSHESVHLGDKKYWIYLNWERHAIMRLRQLTGEFGEQLVTADRLADWGFAIPGSAAEVQAQKRAERRKIKEDLEAARLAQVQAEQAETEVLRKTVSNHFVAENEARPSIIRIFLNDEIDLKAWLPRLTSASWCQNKFGMEYPVLISEEDRRMLLRRQKLRGETEPIYSAVMCECERTFYFIKRMTTQEFEGFTRTIHAIQASEDGATPGTQEV